MAKSEEASGATLKDISKALNVSSTTVHRALAGKEGISDSLREKILKTAEEMGYKLNYAASSMKRKAVKIAVLLPAETEGGSMYFAYLWKGCRSYLKEIEALNVVTEEYGIQNEEEQAMILKQIADAGPEVYSGVLTFSYTRQQAVMTQYVRLTAQKIPVVVLDDELTGIDGLYCISPSEKLIGELCAEFFSLAVPKEGTIIVSGGKKDSKVHANMVSSFCGYLKEHCPGVKVSQTPPYETNGKNEADYGEFCQRLTSIPDVIGVYALTSRSNDALARALTDTGMKGKVWAIGSDLYDKSAQYLQDGVFDVLIYKNAFDKGVTALRLLTDCIIKHITPPAKNTCIISLIFKSNLQFYEDVFRL